MAGAKGKSGGARRGAGRPKNQPMLIDVPNSNDPLTFLVSVMNNQSADSRLRIDAAKALMPFVHHSFTASLAKAGRRISKPRQQRRPALAGSLLDQRRQNSSSLTASNDLCREWQRSGLVLVARLIHLCTKGRFRQRGIEFIKMTVTLTVTLFDALIFARSSLNLNGCEAMQPTFITASVLMFDAHHYSPDLRIKRSVGSENNIM